MFHVLGVGHTLQHCQYKMYIVVKQARPSDLALRCHRGHSGKRSLWFRPAQLFTAWGHKSFAQRSDQLRTGACTNSGLSWSTGVSRKTLSSRTGALDSGTDIRGCKRWRFRTIPLKEARDKCETRWKKGYGCGRDCSVCHVDGACPRSGVTYMWSGKIVSRALGGSREGGGALIRAISTSTVINSAMFMAEGFRSMGLWAKGGRVGWEKHQGPG